MTIRTITRARALPALAVACAMALSFAQPAAAQSATSLDCKGCIKSKQIKNGKVKGKDLKDSTVTGSKIADDAVDGSKIADGGVSGPDIADGAVTLNKLGGDVTALGLDGVALIGPADFHGRTGNSNTDWNVSGIGRVEGGGAPDTGCIVAPVHLPDGVTITEVELMFIDDSIDDFSLTLRRVSLLDRSVETLAVLDTAGIDSPAFMTLSETNIVEPVVNAVDFAYWVRTRSCLDDADQQIYGMRIFYN